MTAQEPIIDPKRLASFRRAHVSADEAYLAIKERLHEAKQNLARVNSNQARLELHYGERRIQRDGPSPDVVAARREVTKAAAAVQRVEQELAGISAQRTRARRLADACRQFAQAKGVRPADEA